MCGVKYIGLVSLDVFAGYTEMTPSLDFIHPTAYVLYGVKYIDLVSLDVFAGYTEITPFLPIVFLGFFYSLAASALWPVSR